MRLLLPAALLAMALPMAAHGQAGKIEIRFCPAARVRAYPLESRRRIESVVLQNAAIINHGAAPLEVTAVAIDLMRDGEAVETRRLAGRELARAGGNSAGLQASGEVTQIPVQFCGGKLVAGGVIFAGTRLTHGQGLLLFQQLMAFQGPRDALRVTVHGRSEGHDVAASGALPIDTAMSRTVFRFPLEGVWWVGVGATPHTGHRWFVPEEFALDIGKLGGEGLDHRGDGRAFGDYYGYGAPVLAAADGAVVSAVDGMAEDASAMRQPGETTDTYSKRMMATQATLLAKGVLALAGNHVVIDHGDGEYSLYAHLKPGSVLVKPGQAAKSGQPIGRLGSSGNSTAPHLHFQVCDSPRVLLDCAGIPISFKDLDIPWADWVRPVQSGDVVVAR
ncbi:MAG TPA: M23 family metallopeptidase [Caulobacteraceae bacterium]